MIDRVLDGAGERGRGVTAVCIVDPLAMAVISHVFLFFLCPVKLHSRVWESLPSATATKTTRRRRLGDSLAVI